MTRSTGLFVATTTAALVLALVLSLLVGGSTAQAVPVTPHTFLGNAFTGTNPETALPVAAGVAIQARIANVNYANSFDTGRNTKTDAGGKVGQVGGSNFHVCGDTTDIPGKQGGVSNDEITFYIANRLAIARDPFTGAVVDPVLFESGNTTQLNLYYEPGSASVVDTFSDDACKIGTELLPTPPPAGPPAAPAPLPSAEDLGVLDIADAVIIVEAGGAEDIAALFADDISLATDLIEAGLDVAVVSAAINVAGALTGAAILGEIEAEFGASIIENASSSVIAEIVNVAEAEAIVDSMELAASASVAAAFDQAGAEESAAVVTLLTDGKGSDVLGLMIPEAAGPVADNVDTLKLEAIFEVSDPLKLTDYMQFALPTTLFAIDTDVVLRRLPNVSAMAVTRGVTPRLGPGTAGDPQVSVVDGISTYIALLALRGLWFKMVGSPAPINSILGKFTRDLSDVKVTLADLAALPEGAPALPTGLIVNSLFSINIESVESKDVAAAHVSMFVEKSWLRANEVQKWSIQFNRLDTQRNAWVPSPSKRVREDQERVFYTVVVPGFSDIAITGSKDLQELFFVVGDLTIVPATPGPGDDVTISARVTNTGADTGGIFKKCVNSQAVYPLSEQHGLEAQERR